MENKEPKFYQKFSRNNDVNGNPYRLMVVYNEDGTPIEAYEARSSTPNKEHEFWRNGIKQLLTVHLQPKEYNRLKRSLNNWSQVEKNVQHCD